MRPLPEWLACVLGSICNNRHAQVDSYISYPLGTLGEKNPLTMRGAYSDSSVGAMPSAYDPTPSPFREDDGQFFHDLIR